MVLLHQVIDSFPFQLLLWGKGNMARRPSFKRQRESVVKRDPGLRSDGSPGGQMKAIAGIAIG